jgi:hypothetical protein
MHWVATSLLIDINAVKNGGKPIYDNSKRTLTRWNDASGRHRRDSAQECHPLSRSTSKRMHTGPGKYLFFLSNSQKVRNVSIFWMKTKKLL